MSFSENMLILTCEEKYSSIVCLIQNTTNDDASNKKLLERKS